MAEKKKNRKRKYSDEIRKKAVDLVRKGKSYYGAAKEVGAKTSLVRMWCIAAGVKSSFNKKTKKTCE